MLKKNVVCYYRFSDQQQDAGYSIQAQKRACLEFAEKNNYNVVREYIDRAFSGTSSERPQFLEMIKDSAKKEWEICLCHKSDRFSRNLYQTLYFTEKLKENGVRVQSVIENFDDSTPEGALMRNMMASLNSYFSVNLRREVLKGMKENSLASKSNGGSPLYGYSVCPVTKKYIINESEAHVVKRMFKLFNSGFSYNEIIDDLEQLGFRNRQGKKFRADTIRNLIKNQRFKGEYLWGQRTTVDLGNKKKMKKQKEDLVIRIQGGMPRIIEDEVFEEAQEIINARKTGNVSRKGSTYLLSGLIFCTCGSKMYVNSRKFRKRDIVKNYKSYRCRYKTCSCNSSEIKAEYIENFVVEELFKYLKDEKNIEHLLQVLNERMQEKTGEKNETKEVLEKRLVIVEKEISNLIKSIAQGLDEEDVFEEVRSRKKEKNDLIEKINNLKDSNKSSKIDAEALKSTLDSYILQIETNYENKPELRELIKKFVKIIKISKESVEVVFNAFLYYNENWDFLDRKEIVRRNKIYKRYKIKKV